MSQVHREDAAVLKAAQAVWTSADVVDLGKTGYEALPYVNRLPALEAAAKALLRNLRKSASTMDTDPRLYELVACAQLFGTGKTRFAQRLSAGLTAGFKNRMHSQL